MNKKLWTGILAAALVLSLGSTLALAAEPQSTNCPGRCGTDGAQGAFVDENGDGICDNFASGACDGGYRCRTGSQDGLRRMQRAPQGPRHAAEDGSWVRCEDADGDGVCDICGAACSADFVDADGDGVCDNYGLGAGRGGHCGGSRGGWRR